MSRIPDIKGATRRDLSLLSARAKSTLGRALKYQWRIEKSGNKFTFYHPHDNSDRMVCTLDGLDHFTVSDFKR